MRFSRRVVVSFFLSFTCGLLFSSYIRVPSHSRKVIKNVNHDIIINCDKYTVLEQSFKIEDPETRKRKTKELENFYETIDDGRNFVVAVKAAEEEKESLKFEIPSQCKFGSKNGTKAEANVSKVSEQFLYVGVMTAGKYINTRF